MKTKDELKALQAKTLAELNTDLNDRKSELFNLRFQKATGQLENTAAIRECKKSIARVKTVIRQRELAGKNA
ncbi:MAG: 50S ribosomal protein L29 [Clostridia bacterium]|nr:50S ribosomal protein L29 [Clostridia bacterium]